MSRPKLFLLDEPSIDFLKILKEFDIEKIDFEGMDTYNVYSADPKDTPLIYTQLTPINTNCTVFCPCTGIDHIDADKVYYLDNDWKETEGKFVTSTAEHTLSLILQLAKLKRMQLFGKTICVLGFGRIGKAVANSGNGLNMFASVITEDMFYNEIETRDRILSRADILTVHIPLTSKTVKLIDSEFISKLKDKCLLINTSRAGIVDYKDCSDALSDGKLGGYANDFNQLYGFENVICTDHIGGNCVDARIQTDKYIANKILEYVRGEYEITKIPYSVAT